MDDHLFRVHRTPDHVPLILAHRGASGYAPENTLAAFRLAREMRADGAELDVQLSGDGVPVVFHDKDLMRLFKRRSAVSDLPLRTLRRLDFSGGFGEKFATETVPTLDEALDALSGLVVNIELKSDTIPDGRLEARVAECVKNAGAAERVVVSSFNPLALAAFRRIFPGVAIAFLFAPGSRRGLRGPLAGYALGTQYLNPTLGLVEKEKVARWHAAGFGVMTWTVNTEKEARRCIGCGVDALITNFPDRIVEIRGRRPVAADGRAVLRRYGVTPPSEFGDQT